MIQEEEDGKEEEEMRMEEVQKLDMIEGEEKFKEEAENKKVRGNFNWEENRYKARLWGNEKLGE